MLDPIHSMRQHTAKISNCDTRQIGSTHDISRGGSYLRLSSIYRASMHVFVVRVAGDPMW